MKTTVLLATITLTLFAGIASADSGTSRVIWQSPEPTAKVMSTDPAANGRHCYAQVRELTLSTGETVTAATQHDCGSVDGMPPLYTAIGGAINMPKEATSARVEWRDGERVIVLE